MGEEQSNRVPNPRRVRAIASRTHSSSASATFEVWPFATVIPDPNDSGVRSSAHLQRTAARDEMSVTTKAIDVRQAQAEIAAAWQKYQQVEKRGLEFGEAVYRWREQFKSRAGCKSEGEGICAILHKLGIPRRTAYWWIDRYEVSVGLKAAPTPKELEEEDNSHEPPDQEDRSAEDEDDPELDDWNAQKLEEILEAARKREEKWRAAHPQGLNSGTKQITLDILKAAEALVEMGYRSLAKSLHPDVGGSHEKMSNLNAAVEWLRKQINTVRKVVGWMKGAA